MKCKCISLVEKLKHFLFVVYDDIQQILFELLILILKMFTDIGRICNYVRRNLVLTTSRLFSNTQIFPDDLSKLSTPPMTPVHSPRERDDEFIIDFHSDNLDILEKGFAHSVSKTD